ncbi:phytoene dehydrogenase-like protein [Saccharomonospora amisosensis]|uniref:Pyridine nucleotide-disulfide oxidoreductase domain-containing protein 2 n=1 Tax=Saccharomonospora amisosensis TaxID=1128677 RepID=A0A7X5UQ23_9PSEU|nr:NAD(P)/FAD-dependent oxidoreductase [Saccharomonospora amisosensis]NIJ12065.1 phytoene dehydrogenase-like protein [Saccharomonospora amisosensis]
MDTVDAVVIGAGPNGLVAANLLADAGWEVLVLEATDQPGGAVRTAELTEPGFAHDEFSAFYPLAAASPILTALGLTAYGLRWRHAPAVLAHVLPDDRCAVLHRRVEDTMASLSAFHAGDGEAWHAQFAAWSRMREPLLSALFTPFPPVRSGLRLARTLGAAQGLRFARMLTMPSAAAAEETYGGDGARLLLAGNALHADLGPEQAGGAVFGWLLCMLGQDVGFPVPHGGAGMLTRALVRRLTALGGRLECEREVTGVLTARGRAVGVIDVSGTRVRASRAVLADVPAPVLYRRLVGPDRLPARLLADLERFHWDAATVKIDWALSGPIPWRNPEAAAAGTVHLDNDLAGLTRYSADLATGTVPDHPMLILGQPCRADPSRAPRGGEVAWAYTRVPRAAALDGDRLRRFADHVQGIVERHAPGFSGRVLGRHVAGPAQLRRANPNLVGGAINGGTAAIHQQLLFRPVPGLGRADTPIDRLYLASASAHPGGAVHGGPGANAARAALVRAGLGGRLYRGVVAALQEAVHAG